MSRLSRLVLTGALAGAAAFVAPAQAAEQVPCVSSPCYQCVMYPCGPGDWVEFVGDRVAGGGVVTVEYQPMVVCVTYPCHQPTPVVVCVPAAALCTPR